MYDLVLKGGTVLDPSQGLNEKMDVAVTGDRISLVAPLISRTEGARVVEALGKDRSLSLGRPLIPGDGDHRQRRHRPGPASNL